MPKVALVTHQFPSREHPYITEWARGLVQAGIDLTILVEQPGGRLAGNHMDEDTLLRRVWRFNSLQPLHFSLPRGFRAGLKALARLPQALTILKTTHPGKPLSVLRKLYEYLPLLGEQFDIIHFNAPQIAIRRFELGQLFCGKTLVSFRGQDISFYPARYDRLLAEADHLHFISAHLLRLAQSRGYDGSKHTLIPPMVDTDFYHPLANPSQMSGPPYILFTAARLEWVKGFEFALQAVALLKQRGIAVDYFIAGDGELKDAVLYTTHQLGIQDNVHLLGWQTPEEIRAWMWKSDLYVLASVSEAFNNSVLQAQACGLPVVCSDAGGLPENIVDGGTGLLFQCRNAWDMAEKIETLLRDEDLRRKMGASGRQRVEGLFDIRRNIDQFFKMYQKVIHPD